MASARDALLTMCALLPSRPPRFDEDRLSSYWNVNAEFQISSRAMFTEPRAMLAPSAGEWRFEVSFAYGSSPETFEIDRLAPEPSLSRMQGNRIRRFPR